MNENLSFPRRLSTELPTNNSVTCISLSQTEKNCPIKMCDGCTHGEHMESNVGEQTLKVLVVLFVIQLGGFAQVSEQTSPRFTLTISLFLPAGAPSGPGQPYIRDLKLVETNISNEPIQEAGCWEHQGIYRVTVFFNGHLLKEQDRVARQRREARARMAPCKVPVSDAVIPPGKTWTRYLPISSDYPMTEAGTYEITVSRNSDLDNPDTSPVVSSNTLTIVVPHEVE
jgi:hypothetical protein